MTEIPKNPGGKLPIKIYSEPMNPGDPKNNEKYDPEDTRQIGDMGDVGILLKQKREQEEKSVSDPNTNSETPPNE